MILEKLLTTYTVEIHLTIFMTENQGVSIPMSRILARVNLGAERHRLVYGGLERLTQAYLIFNR
jgi:hypothetical protein